MCANPAWSRSVSLALLLVAAAQPLHAEGVQWRHDSNAARREAKATNRPVLMDFGTESCFWCKKLDAATFRDPAIIRQLNEQFIPIKIDADKEPALTQSLGIQSYPTLVFTAPDGRILGKHAGFVDAAQLGQQLRRALADSMPAAPVTTKNDVPGTVPVARVPPGVRTTAPPAAPLPGCSERALLAADLLAKAQADHRGQHYLGCLERCQTLIAVYPEQAQAEEARRLAQQIRNDPETARQASAKLADYLGELYLALAETAVRQNQLRQAVAYLERVVQLAPGSSQAQTAQALLGKLPPGLLEPSVPPRSVRAQSP